MLQGRLFTPERELPLASVLVERGRVSWIRPGNHAEAGARLLTRRGDTIAPGFIDLQVNGLAGHDAATGARAVAQISRRLPAYGVTAFLPTLVSHPLPELQEFVGAVAGAGVPGARILGAHLEGPFLSPAFGGAHDAAYLRAPDRTAVRVVLRHPPRMLTLAPELPGALAAARAFTRAGILVAAGHSGASWSEGQAGIAAGVRFATHLFNAMTPWNHREPGLAGALLADQRVTLGIIADGVHVHPSVLELVCRARPAETVALTTDQTAAAGLGAGRYRLAGTAVRSDGVAVRRADGTLAGSAATMDQLVGRAAGLTGVGLQAALVMATLGPARALRLERALGRVRRGGAADLVVLDARHRVRVTLVGGAIAYSR